MLGLYHITGSIKNEHFNIALMWNITNPKNRTQWLYIKSYSWCFMRAFSHKNIRKSSNDTGSELFRLQDKIMTYLGKFFLNRFFFIVKLKTFLTILSFFNDWCFLFGTFCRYLNKYLNQIIKWSYYVYWWLNVHYYIFEYLKKYNLSTELDKLVVFLGIFMFRN